MAEKVMKVSVRDSTMVKPVEEMPPRALWLSNLDLVRRVNHMPSVYFYKPDQNCATISNNSIIPISYGSSTTEYL
ncbi:hypothetical protein ACFX11_033482 [Malus domestica]